MATGSDITTGDDVGSGVDITTGAESGAEISSIGSGVGTGVDMAAGAEVGFGVVIAKGVGIAPGGTGTTRLGSEIGSVVGAGVGIEPKLGSGAITELDSANTCEDDSLAGA